jgi:hypothetical protein
MNEEWFIICARSETRGLYTLWRIHTIRKEAHQLNPYDEGMTEFCDKSFFNNCGWCFEQEGTKPLLVASDSQKKLELVSLRFHYV